MTWVLIFCLWKGYHGGPAAVQFTTKAACEQAGEAIKQKWPGSYDGHLCLKTGSVAADE
jgi:hypothetical protein